MALTPASLAGRTRLLVLQPTPFCNLDCSYCYLPDRNDRTQMSVKTAVAALRWVIETGLAGDRLSIAWHAGEPLVVPQVWYREAMASLAAVVPAGLTLDHSVQTNAVLIDAGWADFLAESGLRVGVSIDGPARLHDAARRTRRGQGTHAAAMRGIAALRTRGVPFHVIAVVGERTAELGAAAFAAFMAGLGATEIGLNFEEVEGAHTTTSLTPGVSPTMRRFLGDLVEIAAGAPALQLREVRMLLAALRDPGFGQRTRNSENAAFEIVSVDARGGLYTYSPELAGLTHPRHGSFRLGDVRRDSLRDVLTSPRFQRLEAEIAAGVQACAPCPYFRLCVGGAPANKLAEHGTAAAAETIACRHNKQALADAVLARLEVDLAPAPNRASVNAGGTHR